MQILDSQQFRLNRNFMRNTKFLVIMKSIGAALLIICIFPSQAKDNTKKEPTLIDSLKYIEGDEKGNEKKALQTELMVAASEKRAMSQLKKLIRKHKGTYIEADLWFRLAELHMRRSKTERFFELHRESETVVNLAPRIVKKASSKREIVKAVSIYEKIQKNNRKFEKMDIVVFNNAFARQILGQNKTAARLYEDLIRLYPRSLLVPDSHLAIGELKFEAKNFKVALKHFLAIENYPKSRVYPYGMYKGAWTFYNLRKEDLALKKLEQVVAYGKLVEKNNIDSRLDLRKEALADMTIFFEDVYPASEAYGYFSKQSGKIDVSPTILKLANIYERHSRYQDKLVVLSALMTKRPNSDWIPQVHDQLVWNYENMKKRDLAVKQISKFYDVCGLKSSWVEGHSDSKNPERTAEKVSGECLTTASSTALKLSAKWLRTWKKNPGYPVFADSAEKTFELYLKNSQPNVKSNQARFTYAELLFQRKKYRTASAQYYLTSTFTKEDLLRHDSAYAAIVSLEKAVKDKWSSKDEERFRVLAKNYLEKNAKGKFQLDIQFKLALIAYEKERYDEAAPLFKELGSQFASSKKGLKAQDLYLDILNIKKDYASLTAYSKELLSVGGDKNRIMKLDRIYQQSWFFQIQDLEVKRDNAKAISEYKKFINKHPGSTLLEKAMWNITQLYYKTFQYSSGALSGLNFYNRFPAHKDSRDLLLKSAQTYESLGQLPKAIQVLEKLISLNTEKTEEWIALVADFSKISGQRENAKKWYKRLLSSSNPAFVSGAYNQLFEISKKSGNDKEAIRYRNKIISKNIQPMASELALEEVELLYKNGSASKAFTEAKKVLNMGESSSQYARSKARFIQARILEDEFVQQSVKTRADRVALVLALKTGKLEKAQKAYQSTMRYGDPKVAVKALQRLAGCYQRFVDDLKSMPLPAGLSPSDEAVFRNEISNLSIPLEEKSVETMAKALEKAKDLELRDGTIADLRERLDALNFRQGQRLQVPIQGAPVTLPTPGRIGS